MLLKDIENYVDTMSSMQYVEKSCILITASLQHRCNVMQLANGAIMVIELKDTYLKYSWNSRRGKLVRSQFGDKPKRTKSIKAKLFNKTQQKQQPIPEFA